jgi:2-polyprenyl-3-methyl-5-hydroxy-6-metoxy-1,4-benzoquinol methylase
MAPEKSNSPDGLFWDQLVHELGLRAFDTRHQSDVAARKAAGEVNAMVLDRLGSRRGALLEIGCGGGRMTVPLAAEFARVVAVDVSANALEMCRAACSGVTNVEFLQGDERVLEQLPGGSFDVVFSYATLQHVSGKRSVEQYIFESVRLLRPGGVAILQLRQPGASARLIDLGAFTIRRRKHHAWSRSWRGHVVRRDAISALVDGAGSRGRLTFENANSVLAIPRHLWVVYQNDESDPSP